MPHVDHVKVEDHLQITGGLDRVDSLADRHVFRQREDIRVHDAPGGLVLVLQKTLDLDRFLRPHPVQDFLRNLFGKSRDEKGCVVRLQFLEDFGDFGRRHLGQQLEAALDTQFVQRLGSQLAVAAEQDREYGLAFLLVEGRNHLGDVGGPKFSQEIRDMEAGSASE